MITTKGTFHSQNFEDRNVLGLVIWNNFTLINNHNWDIFDIVVVVV